MQLDAHYSVTAKTMWFVKELTSASSMYSATRPWFCMACSQKLGRPLEAVEDAGSVSPVTMAAVEVECEDSRVSLL